MDWWIKSKHGSSVLEVILAIAITALIAVPVLSLFTSGTLLLYHAKTRVTAISLANEQLELIRNLPYDSVGTSGGIPTGSLPQTQTTQINAVPYTIDTDITYVDDVYDKIAPLDLLSTDYKKVTITITWPVANTTSSVTLTSTIAPNGIETNTNGGTIFIQVYDSSTIPSTPIQGATVKITAPTTNPPVSLTKKTNSSGIYVLAGTPPGVEAYHIKVSKAGYHSAETYPTDAVNNPNPSPADLNVLVGETTNQYFEIAPLVTSMTIQVTDDSTGLPVSTTLTIHGEKTIGTDGSGAPIYKYNKTVTTDAEGNYQETNFETDTYHIDFDANSGYTLAGYSPILPYTALPSTTSTVNIIASTATPPTVLFTITDANGIVLSNATVRLYTAGLSVDTTLLTNSAGQAFFSNFGTSGSYQVDITLTGYQPYTTNLTLTQHDDETIALAL